MLLCEAIVDIEYGQEDGYYERVHLLTQVIEMSFTYLLQRLVHMLPDWFSFDNATSPRSLFRGYTTRT